MQPSDMDRLIEAHLAAEAAGDPDAACAVYTPDVVHDVVGFPHGPAHDVAGAHAFYEFLVQNIRTERMDPTHEHYGTDHCVKEHLWTGTVPGAFLGVPGHGRRISFRLLHVWEFRDGLISRENVWLDGASIVAQLTAPDAEAPVAQPA